MKIKNKLAIPIIVVLLLIGGIVSVGTIGDKQNSHIPKPIYHQQVLQINKGEIISKQILTNATKKYETNETNDTSIK